MFSFLNYRIYLNYNFRTTVFCPVSCCSCWFSCSKSCTPQSTPSLFLCTTAIAWCHCASCNPSPFPKPSRGSPDPWGLAGLYCVGPTPGTATRREGRWWLSPWPSSWCYSLSLSLPLWNCVLVCLWGCLFFRVANGVFVWGFSFQFWRHSMWVNFPALRVFFLMFLRLQSPK